MSSESGDNQEIVDKPRSPTNVNTDAEPMVVDGTNGNEAKEVADDKLEQVRVKSLQQDKDKEEKKAETFDEACDKTDKFDVEELADKRELTEPDDSQNTVEETTCSQECEDKRDIEEDIEEEEEENLDRYYQQLSDSDSERELEALRDMGNSKTKDKTKPGKKGGTTSYQNSRNAQKYPFNSRWSRKDTEDYRKGYPGKKDTLGRLNLQFYSNTIESRPNGDKIDVIHEKWYGDYDRLESHHGYIQWLFPIRENGMNVCAQELQVKEAEAIKKNPETLGRVLKSYKMMLNFYGMKLKDDQTGELERAEDWRSRFHHLNRSMHNYLRITRILKSLGELGFEHLKAPFVRFMLKEALVHKTLENTVDSCYNYWIETIKDDKIREDLRDFADNIICSDP